MSCNNTMNIPTEAGAIALAFFLSLAFGGKQSNILVPLRFRYSQIY